MKPLPLLTLLALATAAVGCASKGEPVVTTPAPAVSQASPPPSTGIQVPSSATPSPTASNVPSSPVPVPGNVSNPGSPSPVAAGPTSDASNGGMQAVKPGEAGTR